MGYSLGYVTYTYLRLGYRFRTLTLSPVQSSPIDRQSPRSLSIRTGNGGEDVCHAVESVSRVDEDGFVTLSLDAGCEQITTELDRYNQVSGCWCPPYKDGSHRRHTLSSDGGRW
jgi:hypothetical protein